MTLLAWVLGAWFGIELGRVIERFYPAKKDKANKKE